MSRDENDKTPVDQLDMFPELPKIDKPFRGPSFKGIQYPVWTKNKARLIERYLYYFVLVTKHGTYIDGFAAPQRADTPDSWAAKLVLETEPGWLRKFFLCDESQKGFESLRELSGTHKNRDIRLYAGDFNKIVSQILAPANVSMKEAVFCLLDQRTFECHWDTVAALSRYKPGPYKIELFYFLAAKWLGRAMAAVHETRKLDQWWGGDGWRDLRGQSASDIAGCVCERFRTELGYEFATPWPIFQKEDGGPIMYYMIHASDHVAAPGLMDRAYRQAVVPKEPMDQLTLEFEQWNGN